MDRLTPLALCLSFTHKQLYNVSFGRQVSAISASGEVHGMKYNRVHVISLLFGGVVFQHERFCASGSSDSPVMSQLLFAGDV